MRERQINTTMRRHFTPIRMAIVQKQRITRIGEDVEKLESLCFPGGTANGTAPVEMVWQFLKNN